MRSTYIGYQVLKDQCPEREVGVFVRPAAGMDAIVVQIMRANGDYFTEGDSVFLDPGEALNLISQLADALERMEHDGRV